MQLVIAALLAVNYRRLSHTPIGKAMLALAALFLAQGLLATASYTMWAHRGYGPEIALPLAAISVMSLAGLLILYTISRM
jgi:hypothetical protein